MLLKQTQLDAIKAGNISVVFRKWAKPRIKQGSLIKTSVGMLEIQKITEVLPGQIELSDAHQAGYQSLADLMRDLESRPEGKLYKIRIRYNSPDPRIELRNQVNITPDELQLIISRLQKFDKLSRQGPWVMSTLTAIEEHPEARAKELSEKLDFSKDWLKTNIRKLKNIGLTISLETGYRLSPRGQLVLNRWRSMNNQ